ncbi:hypothetical protein KGF57_000339 [Candida theae]|uniref:Ribosomal protein S2 n=1 Tax=Candida theae TaxID=1198502 RepID=A0AAD5BJR4_9ASCO|nr:uncharacterized protein KGF57_000339 [Candida theae]KAI5967499.1 hypothetical protein KGF57_000339 [Candida theae]
MLRTSFGRPLRRSLVRYYAEPTLQNTSPTEPNLEHTLSHKELREQAIAEALAREEEAIQKSKQIRELTEKSKELINVLNKTPTNLMSERIAKLNTDISKIPKEKIKQLDEELREYMTNNMHLTDDVTANRPWAQKNNRIGGGNKSSKNDDSKAKASSMTSQYTAQFPNLKPTPDYKDYSEQELYLRSLNHLRTSGALGSKLENIYKPQRDTSHPPSINQTTISNLMAAGCHLGHATSSFRSNFQPFVYGTYNGIHLIDLNQTISQLQTACKVIEGVSEKGGVILFVGTHKNWSIQESLVAAADRSKGYYVSKRWIPGTITNYIEVSRQIKDPSMKQQIDMENKPINSQVTSNSIIKPDLVILLNPVENRNCIKECLSACIPTIALCDTDMEPSLITYPIPCNDENVRSVNLMLGIMSKAAEAGVKKRLDIIKQLKESERETEKQQLQGQQQDPFEEAALI